MLNQLGMAIWLVTWAIIGYGLVLAYFEIHKRKLAKQPILVETDPPRRRR